MKNGRVTSGNQRRLFSIEEHLFRENPKEYRAYRTCFIIIEIPFQRHGRVVRAIAEYYTSFSIFRCSTFATLAKLISLASLLDG